MRIPKTSSSVAAAALALSASTHAAPMEEPQHQTHAGSVLPTIQVAGADAALRHRFESLPAQELKVFYLRCARLATAVRLTGGEAATCSIGYDVLLKRHFAGDFEALLAWSKNAVAPTGEAVSTSR